MGKQLPVPVFDLHCDLLSYLAFAKNGSPMNEDDIGAAIPHLQRGHVKLQVLAIFTPANPDKNGHGLHQAGIYKDLLANYSDYVEAAIAAEKDLDLSISDRIKVIPAIENASGFCTDDEDLKTGFATLEKIIADTGPLLYIGFTHWSENRFGGGNDCHTGLKDDGRALLEYLDGRQIAVDFSHASDELAFEILDYIDTHHLTIPVIASHSNFRIIQLHERNLPDELASEIIRRNGLIGMNFIQPFVHHKRPEALFEHIQHGLQLGGGHAVCFGADYFYEAMAPPTAGFETFFFDAHCNASKFPAILEELKRHVSAEAVQNVSHRNVTNFIQKLWSSHP